MHSKISEKIQSYMKAKQKQITSPPNSSTAWDCRTLGSSSMLRTRNVCAGGKSRGWSHPSLWGGHGDDGWYAPRYINCLWPTHSCVPKGRIAICQTFRAGGINFQNAYGQSRRPLMFIILGRTTRSKPCPPWWNRNRIANSVSWYRFQWRRWKDKIRTILFIYLLGDMYEVSI